MRMATILFDGVAYGMLLFVLACGLAVTLGLMNFVNLAHGAFAMAGGYVTVILMDRWGVPFLACLPAAFIVAAALGLRAGAHALRPHVRPLAISTRCCSRSAWCSWRSTAVDWAMGSSQQNIKLPAWLQGRREILGVQVGIYRSFIIVICGALAVGLQLGLMRTALRQPPARRRRRCARGARPRHPGRHGVRRRPSPWARALPAWAARWASSSWASIPTSR